MDNDNELVKVKCPIVESNELGYYVTYRSDMGPDDEIFVEPDPEVESEKPAKAKKAPAV
jgi:hypothetical protein